MKKLPICWAVLIFCLVFSLHVQAAEFQKGYLDYSPISRKYVLGPNDVINLSFLGFPEFNQENIRVQPDGKILISTVGSINAAGLTLEELQEILVEKFKVIFNKPMVSLTLAKTRPFIVHITGAVLSPGSYEMNTDTTNSSAMVSNDSALVERKTPILSNILVAAGGITPDSDLEHIQISGKYDNSKYEINLLNLIDKGDSKQDLYLMSGDTVYVPKLATPYAVDTKKYSQYAGATFLQNEIPVRVLGYVNNAGLVMLDAKYSPRLNTAISKAGGYVSGSASPPKKVIVSRTGNNGEIVSKIVNPMKEDIVLLPNDIVYVPEKTAPVVGKTFDYLTRIVSPVSTFANGYNNWTLIFDPKRFGRY